MSGKTSKKMRWGGALVLAAFAFLALPTCKIGLGKAVDTEPPKIEIGAPSSNMIVRDTFVLSGTWSDDGELDSITVKLLNTDTNAEFNFNAEFEATEGEGKNSKKSGTWSCKINPFTEKVVDGPYSVSVTATDKFPHATIASVAFKIDNTPPLVVLQRPSTVAGAEDGKFDSYGQEFTLKGQAADDSDIDSIVVDIFDTTDLSKPLTTVTIPNVPPTIDLTVAKWGDDAYKKLYGDNLEAGTKKFVCKITAYDSARKVPAEDGDKGNSITYFYLYNDIFSELLNTNSETNPGFKVTELYKILNSTYTGEKAEAAKKALEKLSNEQYARIINSSFSLNPKNNPTYDVSGYTDLATLKYKMKDNDRVKLLNNSKLVINLKAGLDEAVIDSDTIGISIIRCNEEGTIYTDAENAQEIVLIRPYKDKNGNVLIKVDSADTAFDTEDKVNAYIAAREKRISTVGTGFSIITEAGTKDSADKIEPSNLRLGSYYRFKVTAYDANEKLVCASLEDPNSDYAFLLNSSGAVPTLEVEASLKEDGKADVPVDKNTFDIKGTQSVLITGKSKIEEGDVDVIIKLEYTDSTGDIKSKTLKTFEFGKGRTDGEGTPAADNSSVTYSFEHEIPIDATGATGFVNGTNNITITTYKVNETQKVDKAYTINLDTEKPTISDITIDGMEYVAGTSLNGTITVKAVAMDNEAVESARYEIYKGDETTTTGTGDLATPSKLRSDGFTIDTRSYYLYKNNNKSDGYEEGTIKVKIYAKDKAGNESDAGEVILTINQQSDIPVINFSESALCNDPYGKDDISITDKRNIFEKKEALYISISDDDGLASVEMYYDGAKVDASKLPTLNAGSKAAYSINKRLVDELGFAEGYHTIQFKVKDSVGTYDENKFDSNVINIFIYDNPISLDAYYGTGDNAEKIQTDSYVYNVKDAFSVTLKAKEKDGHLDTINWKDDASGTGSITLTEAQQALKTEQLFTETVSKPAYSTKVKRTYTATNKFGLTAVAGFTYNFDLDKPTLTTPKVTYSVYESGKPTQKEDETYSKEFAFDATKTLTLYVTAADNGITYTDNGTTKNTKDYQTGVSGVEYAVISGKQTEWNSSWTKTSSTTTLWWTDATKKTENYVIQIPSDTIADDKEGQYTIFIRAVDNVGNESDKQIVNVIADKQIPVISGPESISENSKVDVEVSGTVTETYLREFTAKVETSANGTTWADAVATAYTIDETPETTGTYTTAQDWKVTVKADGTNDGLYRVKITPKDLVGKTTTWTSDEFRIDTVNPALNVQDDNFTIGGVNFAGVSGNWYNGTDLKLEGFYNDEGSGITEVEYTVTPADGTANLEAELTTKNAGSGKYTFNSTISGFSESTSTTDHSAITLKTTDKAGNVSDSTTISIKIDTTTPTIGETDSATSTYYVAKINGTELMSQGNVKLVNGNSDITIGVPVSDELSGVQEVLIAFGSKNFKNAKTATLNSTTGLYEYTVPKADLAGLNGAVYAQATDVAGNKSDSLLFNFNVDTSAPDVSFTTHSTGSTVNKTITIKGIAMDDQKLDEIKLEVSTDGGTNYTKLVSSKTTASMLSGSVWTYVLNTNVDDYNDKTLKLKATATDNAGNANEAEIELTVDQNSDRPVITLDLANNGAIISNASFTIKVADDDGVATGVTLKVSASETKPSWSSVSELTLQSGSGTFTIPSEGTTKLWFYVQDAANGEFETNLSASSIIDKYAIPYIKFTDTGTDTDNNEEISCTYDNTKPTITTMAYGFGSTAADAVAAAKDSTSSSYATLDATGNKFGGTKKAYVVLAVTPNDANGIASLTATGLKGDIITFTKPDSSSNGNCVWYSNTLEAGALQTSTISIIATDASGLQSAASTAGIEIDIESPTLSFGSIASTVKPEINGNVSDPNGVETFKYLVLNDAYYSARGVVDTAKVRAAFEGTLPTEYPSDSQANSTTTWPITTPVDAKDLVKQDGSWKKELEGLPGSAEALKAYYLVSSKNDIYTLQVYFYAVDSLGNVELKAEDVEYNPYGNRPTVKVNDPTGTKEMPASKNGTIRISGNAAKGEEGTENIGAVYVQFDVNQDGKFTDADKDLLKTGKYAANYTVVDAKNNNANATATIKADIAEIASAAEPASLNAEAIGGSSSSLNDFWGIKVNGVTAKPSASWFISVNEDYEFQTNDNDIYKNSSETEKKGKEYQFAVRAIAISANGTFGNWSDEQFIKIDTNIPEVDGNAIIKGEGGSSKTYEQDMYLKGANSIEVKAVDSDGVTKIIVYTATTKEGLLRTEATVDKLTYNATIDTSTGEPIGAESSLGTTGVILEPLTDGTKKGYTLTYPISTATSTGTKYIKVEAHKSNGNSAYEIFSVNFDNTAPKINNLKFNSVTHKADEYESDGVTIKTNNEDTRLIVNSNGKFTLAGQVEDSVSGYERVGFYIVRGDGTTYEQRMYDPMTANKKISIRNASTGATSTPKITEKSEGIADATLGSSPQNMYGATKTVTVTDSGAKLSYTGTADPYIRSGGIVCINDTYIKMIKVEGTTVTLETATTATGSVSAFFPYLQFVDNMGSEKTDDTGLTVSSGDDGDGMPESIIKSQSTYDWDATLQSQNIPDGPCKVVIFAWDKAGNISAASYEASIQNNAPRLVKLHLGTDLNGNSKYSDNEFVSYDVLGEVGKQSSYKNMSTYAYKGKSFRVKDKLAVVPEFVGGNGVTYSTADDATYSGIKMVALTAAEDDQTINKTSKTTAVSVGGSKLISSDVSKFDTGSTMVANRAYTQIEEPAGTFVSKRNNIWLYEIPSAAFGGASGESPAADLASGQGHRAVSFTFWDDTEDTTQGVNSSYCYLRISDLIVDVKDDDKPIVEIHPFYWNSKDDCSVPLDENTELPLGHIDLEEPFATTNPTTKPQVSGQVYIRGRAYDNTKHGTITMITPGTGEEHVVAKYENGTWSTVKTDWPSNWLDFEVTSDTGITQDGHEVEWCFTVSMTPYGVANDQIVRGYATDAQNNNGSTTAKAETVQTGGTKDAKDNVIETCMYKMDFVPYIQSVSDKDGNSISRSRLGRYPVRAGEKIRINGMNFAKTASYTVTFKKSDNTTASTVANANVTKLDDGVIEVTAPQYSAFVEVSVTQNSVTKSTQNNTNSNTVGYNIQKAKKWKTVSGKQTATDSEAGYDFWTDDCYLSVWKVGTAFANSSNPIRGTVERMTPDTERWIEKQQKGKNKSGTGTPTDGSLTAIWGGEDNMTWEEVLSGNYAGSRGCGLAPKSDAGFFSPPSQTDMVIIKGGTSAKVGDMVMYVVLDDGWGDQGTFGRGLLLARDGTSVQSDLYTLEKTADDKQRDQFQNPKITGFYSDTDEVYYVYVTYYDKYTKCLKYAYAKCKDDNSGNTNYSDHFIERVAASDYDNDKRSPVVIDGVDTVGVGGDIGQWSDVKVLGDKPVVVYYDKIGKQLKYAIGNATKPTSWTKGTLNKPTGSDLGRFVSIEVDGGNNVHIVAQDADNAVLYYGCTSDLSSDITWHKVDATSSVGRWTDIKLENPTGSGYAAKPVVTYMDTAYLNTTKAVKIAYIEDATKGTWEAMTDPATFEASDMKLSLVTKPLEGTATEYSRYGIGINSTSLVVDFLRGEAAITE